MVVITEGERLELETGGSSSVGSRVCFSFPGDYLLHENSLETSRVELVKTTREKHPFSLSPLFSALPETSGALEQQRTVPPPPPPSPKLLHGPWGPWPSYVVIGLGDTWERCRPKCKPRPDARCPLPPPQVRHHHISPEDRQQARFPSLERPAHPLCWLQAA